MAMDAKIDDLVGIYRDLAEIVGVELAYKIYKEFRGQQIYFPQGFLDSKRVQDIVKGEYTGKNTKELAKRYGYSERRIRQFVSG